MEMRDFPGVEIHITPSVGETIFGLYSTIVGTTSNDIDAAAEVVKVWCLDQFGEDGWHMVFTTFLIQDSVKATAFRVRWC